MNKHEVSGAAREVKGKVEKGVGNLTGDEQTQAHGAAEEMKGKTEKKAGQLQGKAEDLKNDVKDSVNRATE
jgi:uncharacterized protein YjbJ (UPF0337 family)